jgi:hypothetical protein
MSQLKVDTITDEAGTGSPSLPNGLTVGGVNYPSTGPLSNRNKIINGAMVIDQRNAGAAVTPTGSAYTLDRWLASLTQSSKYSVQQSTTAPTGFNNSLLVTSLSAYSVGAGDFFLLRHYIEGFNFADLGWGSANAQSVTMSFWVRSSLTGTFGGSLQNSAENRSYPFTYTINAANTWEQKILTIAGDTSGTWVGATNAVGVRINFGLGAGSTFGGGTAGAWVGSDFRSVTGAVSVVGTNGATWQITGVQLEAGTVATPFEHRSFGQELALCMRYYYIVRGSADGLGVPAIGNLTRWTTNVEGYCVTHLPTPLRATPTISFTGSLLADYGGIAAVPSSFDSIFLNLPSHSAQWFRVNHPATAAGQSSSGVLYCTNNTANSFAFDAEL